MANQAIPKLREYLQAHEGDIAHDINDFSLLADVFKHLEGRWASKDVPVAVAHRNAADLVPPPEVSVG